MKNKVDYSRILSRIIKFQEQETTVTLYPSWVFWHHVKWYPGSIHSVNMIKHHCAVSATFVIDLHRNVDWGHRGIYVLLKLLVVRQNIIQVVVGVFFGFVIVHQILQGICHQLICCYQVLELLYWFIQHLASAPFIHQNKWIFFLIH